MHSFDQWINVQTKNLQNLLPSQMHQTFFEWTETYTAIDLHFPYSQKVEQRSSLIKLDERRTKKILYILVIVVSGISYQTRRRPATAVLSTKTVVNNYEARNLKVPEKCSRSRCHADQIKYRLPHCEVVITLATYIYSVFRQTSMTPARMNGKRKHQDRALHHYVCFKK